MNIGLKMQTIDDISIIEIEGEVDTYTSSKIKQDILKVVDQTQKIVISMEKVKFIDSTGLGILIGVLKKVKEKEGEMIIVSPNSYINQIFEITGLFKVFKIVETIQQAVDHMKKNPEM
ncbi:MAG: STAS domain-containing protein [Candidatus Calescibacterium sp.]|nr:STAS domain-containing protein [Candidatus Calescibacterium sp.]MCX7972832.1 STAS domain-containing protein [bacterium]MDW8195246.1 STAS domain-containing protein [Candidatus Calescibacterium sp.]